MKRQSKRVSVREQQQFAEQAVQQMTQEVPPEDFPALAEAIQQLPTPPLSEGEKGTLLAWHTTPGPHPGTVRALALSLTKELITGRYAQSTDPAIVRFRTVYLRGEKINHERQIALAALIHNMRELRRRWEQEGDSHALAVALQTYDEWSGQPIEDPANIEEDWLRRGLLTFARLMLPKVGSGRHQTTPVEVKRALGRARRKKNLSKDDEAEDTLNKDLTSARRAVAENRALSGQQRERATEKVENQILNEALASNNPHLRNAAVKIKKQRDRERRPRPR